MATTIVAKCSHTLVHWQTIRFHFFATAATDADAYVAHITKLYCRLKMTIYAEHICGCSCMRLSVNECEYGKNSIKECFQCI